VRDRVGSHEQPACSFHQIIADAASDMMRYASEFGFDWSPGRELQKASNSQRRTNSTAC
jgi:hypothetical protein